MECPECKTYLGEAPDCKCGWKAASLQAPQPTGPNAPVGLVAARVPSEQPSDDGSTVVPGDENPASPSSAVDDPTPPRQRAPEIEINKSKAKRLTVLKGDRNKNIGKVEINYWGRFEEKGRASEEKGRADDERREQEYFNAVGELPPRPPELPHFSVDGGEARLRELKGNWLMLVSCADGDIALSSAYGLLDRLDLSRDGRKLWLNCEAKTLDSLDLDIDVFLKSGRSPTKGRSAVIVDATGETGKIFLDPLIKASRGAAQYVKQQLKGNRLFMICLADSEYLASRLPDGLESQCFDFWDIQFLTPLLKHHFPNHHPSLQATIEEQKNRGWWSGRDGEFCAQIKKLIRKGRLEEEIARLRQAHATATSEKADAAPPVIAAAEAEQIIVEAAWFACAYFPNLGPRDFQRVVASLLDSQTAIVTVHSLKTTEQGEVVAAQTAVQKQLAEIWQQKGDSILSLAGLELAPYKESGRVVDFADTALRTRLRGYFAFERRFYLEEQFRKIQEHRLLFDRSPRVVESVIALAVDLTLASSDQHEIDWLIDVISSISQSASEEDEGSVSVTAPTSNDMAGRSYSSVAVLVRRLLEDPRLEPAVNGLFDQLMRSRCQEAVFQIVRRLRFSPQFDFYWVKQLVDRGTEPIRERAYRYLSGRLRQQDLGIYETLRTLQSWLPDREREVDEYSPSNECALLLLIEYCLASTSEFDARYFGAWPCRYPLLAALDTRSPEADAEAERNLELLAGWLFHPGMESVLNESVTSLLAALVAEWAVILLGREVAPKENEGSPSTASINGQGDEASFVLDLLIKQIARSTAPERQKELAQCWGAVTEYLLFLIANFEGYTSEQRRQLRARRSIILDATKRFNTFRRQQ
jgi:hypothetical protein